MGVTKTSFVFPPSFLRFYAPVPMKESQMPKPPTPKPTAEERKGAAVAAATTALQSSISETDLAMSVANLRTAVAQLIEAVSL